MQAVRQSLRRHRTRLRFPRCHELSDQEELCLVSPSKMNDPLVSDALIQILASLGATPSTALVCGAAVFKLGRTRLCMAAGF